jgi:hypothetical protein
MRTSVRNLSEWSSELPLSGVNDSIRNIDPSDRKRWAEKWRKKTADVQAEIEPLIFEYYGLNDQERILVEDTCAIFAKSATPGTIDTAMPTLEPLKDAEDLKHYAETLAETLRSWSIDNALSTKLTAGVNEPMGLGVLKIERTGKRAKAPPLFRVAPLTDQLAEAVKRIEETASTTNGTLVYLRDETWWFEGPAITLAKPALRGRWTRTAALNDAAEIYASIQQSRPQNT